MNPPPPPPQSAYSQVPTYNQAKFVYENRETIGEAAQTAQTIQKEAETGFVDETYLPHKSIHGALKLVQCIVTLIAYIISEFSICSAIGFNKFLTLGSCIATLVLWVIHLLKLDARIFRCDCCKWPIVLLVFHGVICICYFFTDIVLAIKHCDDSTKAAAAFGFFALFAYSAGLVISVRQFMESRKQPIILDAESKY